MAKVLKAQEIEAEVEEDSGYFYQRLGELRFTPESDLSSHGSQKGYEQRLAVASRHGVAVFADHRGDIPHSVRSYRLIFVDSHCHCHCTSSILSFYYFFLYSVSDGSKCRFHLLYLRCCFCHLVVHYLPQHSLQKHHSSMIFLQECILPGCTISLQQPRRVKRTSEWQCLQKCNKLIALPLLMKRVLWPDAEHESCNCRELPPANADEVCLYTMSLADASVALSCDEELLAAWDHQQISVWSLGGLVDRRDTQPLTNWLVPGGIAVKQVKLGSTSLSYFCCLHFEFLKHLILFLKLHASTSETVHK